MANCASVLELEYIFVIQTMWLLGTRCVVISATKHSQLIVSYDMNE